MSLWFGPHLFAITAEPLARSVALAALRITVVVIANDLTGPATDDDVPAEPRASCDHGALKPLRARTGYGI